MIKVSVASVSFGSGYPYIVYNSRHERIAAAIARAIQGGSSTKARFIKERGHHETKHGMRKINTEARFGGRECHGLGEILPERTRVGIRIAETEGTEL